MTSSVGYPWLRTARGDVHFFEHVQLLAWNGGAADRQRSKHHTIVQFYRFTVRLCYR